MKPPAIKPATVIDIAPRGLFDRIEEVIPKVLAADQVDMPVIHRFAPGLYIREVHMPAGAFVIGHEHRTKHFNVMLSGHLVMVNPDGTTTDFVAPQSYTADIGRKVAYIIKDTVWQNIFPADTKDIDELEEKLLIVSDDFKLTKEQQENLARAEHEVDRIDYERVLKSMNLHEDYVRALSEYELDVIDMPFQVHPYRLGRSAIEGTGYFLTVPAEAGQILAPARYNGNRTPAGRYVNHGINPNAEMRFGEDGTLYLVAIKNIRGCVGGGMGTEVTTNYAHTLKLVNNHGDGVNLCQQQ